MARLTALLQRLHTPSKSMIGRVSVWKTLLSTASGDQGAAEAVGDVDVEEEWGIEVVATPMSLETVEKQHEVDGEDEMTQPMPLHPGDDEVLADEKGTATNAWHVAIRDNATAAAAAMIIVLATRRRRRESLLKSMDWVREGGSLNYELTHVPESLNYEWDRILSPPKSTSRIESTRVFGALVFATHR